MSAPLLIVQNITREGPGLLVDLLQETTTHYDLVDLSKGEAFPDPRAYKALIVLGGPPSANDTSDAMTRELSQVKLAMASNLPCLGICLGLQVLVKAAGGRIVKAPQPEIGFVDQQGVQYRVQLTPEGKADPLLQGLPNEVAVFQLHGEAVEVTPEMRVLATGTSCHNQIVRVADRAYGIQSHFELTPAMLEVWGSEDPDLLPIGLPALRARFADIQASYNQTGRALLTNFLRLANLQ